MKNINLMCPIGYTGYGITSLNILQELSRRAFVSLFPIGKPSGLNSEDQINLINHTLKNSRYFDSTAPCVKIWHQNDLASRIGSGSYCSFPFFELDTLSEIETHNINSCDKVFTATNWSKNILEKNGVTIPIVVCPLGVDSSIFSVRPKNTDIQTDKYIFFHIGKWEKRKSQDVILNCFEKAFSEKDNVELWLFPHNPFLNEHEMRYWINMVKYNKLSNKIQIFNRFDTQYELAATIANADCGIFVSRAEGWNNEILESMSMNKPCIVTNYSAHTEYCNNENSYLVEVTDLEVANDDKWFFGQGNWAKIGQNQYDSIIEYMRYVYYNNIRSNDAGLKTSQKYSWSNTAEIIYANTQ